MSPTPGRSRSASCRTAAPIPIKGNKPLGEKIVAITKHPTDVDSGEFERMLRKVLFAAPAAATAGKTANASTGRRAAAR